MLEEVKVSEWMSSPVTTITLDTPITDAHQIMKDKGIRRLPVVDKHGKLVGIVTIGDVREAKPSDASTLSIWEMNYLLSKLKVEKVMTKNPLTVNQDAFILDAAQIMLEKKISGVPVVDNENKLIGILTESDIFRMLVKSRVST